MALPEKIQAKCTPEAIVRGGVAALTAIVSVRSGLNIDSGLIKFAAILFGGLYAWV